MSFGGRRPGFWLVVHVVVARKWSTTSSAADAVSLHGLAMTPPPRRLAREDSSVASTTSVDQWRAVFFM